MERSEIEAACASTWATGSLETLQGQRVVGVEIVGNFNGNQAVVLETPTQWWILTHEQDCCESVTLEDGEDELYGLVGGVVVVAEEATSSDGLPKDELDDSFMWTFYRFRTTKGDCTLRFYGTSNGYYSESVSVFALDKVGA